MVNNPPGNAILSCSQGGLESGAEEGDEGVADV